MTIFEIKESYSLKNTTETMKQILDAEYKKINYKIKVIKLIFILDQT